MKVCIVDLNNFAAYPTISVGLLVAVLRRAGMEVDVFSPLSTGVRGVQREPKVPLHGLLLDRLSYRTAVSRNRLVTSIRRRVSKRRRSELIGQSGKITSLLAEHFDRGRPDAVLVSTYLMYFPLCRSIARSCKQRGTPLLIGGQYFVHPDVLREWLSIDGVSAIVGGEVEMDLPEIVRDLVDGNDLSRFPGVYTPSDSQYQPAPPLQNLDAVPFADYRDFDWNKYPTAIVPMITGRGCAWGACTFCSDVTSSAGRTFRSRSLENALAEVEHQAARHHTSQFVFTDLKLNSNTAVWRGLIAEMPRLLPDAKWIGAVHIGNTGRDHLEPEQLVEAREAGMVRLTTGLESGSQQVLESMRKGTDLSHTSRCLRAASDAGISVRVTLIVGYPGETADDVRSTARYLKQHERSIERARLNRFQIVIGTRFHDELVKPGRHFAGISHLVADRCEALIDHQYDMTQQPEYRRAMDELLGVVHRLNRKPLKSVARAFEGVM
jgi:anaerobic magnesium-protoporphyrin IX monomethyl ester cyclase